MNKVYRLLFAGCIGLFSMQGASAVAQEKTAVRFQVFGGSLLNVVNWVMIEKGFCDKAGIKCVPLNLASGPLAQQAAAAGSLDLLYSSIEYMVQSVSRGMDLQIVAAQAPNNIYTFSVRKGLTSFNYDAPYPENMKGLKGLRVGVTARGSGTETYVKALLTGAGLPTDYVTYVAVGGPSTAFAALAAKQIDAAFSWDPMPAMCANTDVCKVAIDLRKGEGPAEIKEMNGGFMVWQARRQYVEKNAGAIDAFRVALSEAAVWVKDPKNHAEVFEITSKNFQLGDMPNREKVMDQVVNEAIAQVGTQFGRKSAKAASDFLLSAKAIDKGVDPNAIIYDKIP
jgi:NitT/TauT family transport system substrate-binding protein